MFASLNKVSDILATHIAGSMQRSPCRTMADAIFLTSTTRRGRCFMLWLHHGADSRVIGHFTAQHHHINVRMPSGVKMVEALAAFRIPSLEMYTNEVAVCMPYHQFCHAPFKITIPEKPSRCVTREQDAELSEADLLPPIICSLTGLPLFGILFFAVRASNITFGLITFRKLAGKSRTLFRYE